MLSLLSDGVCLRSETGGQSWMSAAATGALNLNGAGLLNRVAGQ
jgi:hypothetical protein